MFRKTDSRVVFSAKSVNLKLKFKAKTTLDNISGRTGGEKIKSNLFQRNLTQSVLLFPFHPPFRWSGSPASSLHTSCSSPIIRQVGPAHLTQIFVLNLFLGWLLLQSRRHMTAPLGGKCFKGYVAACPSQRWPRELQRCCSHMLKYVNAWLLLW